MDDVFKNQDKKNPPEVLEDSHLDILFSQKSFSLF